MSTGAREIIDRSHESMQTRVCIRRQVDHRDHVIIQHKGQIVGTMNHVKQEWCPQEHPGVLHFENEISPSIVPS